MTGTLSSEIKSAKVLFLDNGQYNPPAPSIIVISKEEEKSSISFLIFSVSIWTLLNFEAKYGETSPSRRYEYPEGIDKYFFNSSISGAFKTPFYK